MCSKETVPVGQRPLSQSWGKLQYMIERIREKADFNPEMTE